jgi:pimeloyl-ACP methyl ester carboxylesterase
MPSARRVACVLALLCVFLWASSIGCLWAFESRLVYKAEWTRSPTRSLAGAGYTPVYFRTADGLQLEAGTLAYAHSRSDGYWILFCLPSGGSLYSARLQNELRRLHGFGYDVLAFNYRGFGRNPGVPTERGLYEDALAAYRYLSVERGVAPARVILAGRSLGAAVAAEVAAHVEPAGLVLVSPIDSVPLAGARLYPFAPVRYLASNKFDVLAKADRIAGPVVLIRGTKDAVLPVAAARQLFARIPSPKLMVEAPGFHRADVFAAGSAVERALKKFWPVSATRHEF